jgi:hypothetical protein
MVRPENGMNKKMLLARLYAIASAAAAAMPPGYQERRALRTRNAEIEAQIIEAARAKRARRALRPIPPGSQL